MAVVVVVLVVLVALPRIVSCCWLRVVLTAHCGPIRSTFPLYVTPLLHVRASPSWRVRSRAPTRCCRAAWPPR
jgi:hypothetical protein